MPHATVMRHPLVCALVGGALLVSALIAAEAADAQAPAADTSARDANRDTDNGVVNGVGAPDAYRIGPEDVLQISVWKNDAMSRAVPVRPDGMISLPLLNDVQAGGLTALELREVLTQKLAEYIPSPEVSVIVSDVRSFKVSVMGEVARPGRFDLRSWTTVVDVLALAGGFSQFAARSRIVILRPEGKTMKRIPFNYNKLTGDQENFYLRNGDIVLVP
jgi:polysaccharide biosynthesis/export protein